MVVASGREAGGSVAGETADGPAAGPQLTSSAPTNVGDLGRSLRRLVRHARETTGRRLTCRELATKTGYGRSTISNWLEGRSLPSPDGLGDLLVALGATCGEQRMLATARDDIDERRRAAPKSAPAPPAQISPAPVGQAAHCSLRVRYSLPADVAAFTGRDEELGLITAAVSSAAGAGTGLAIYAIGGMPGVGKTTLTVHLAHRLRDRFRDWQLFIDLHAHTPGQEPVVPEVALAGLLTAAGVDARYLPSDLEGLAGLWRDRTAGQQGLLVLDNAASSDQVTPLLPGGQGCLVVVTSRRHLGDLPGAAVQIRLEALPPEAAQEMFLRLAPRAGTAPATAVAEVTRLAGQLPLAISLLARLYARHPSWALADLIGETTASMLTLVAEKSSVAAAFELSHRYLAPGQQQFFRRLGLHLGATVDAYAAAALAGIPVQDARGQLDALHGEGLLTEPGYRRYGMHDLIRRYVQDRAATDPATGRDQARERLLDYYQHTAALAEARLARQTRPTPATALVPSPAAAPCLPDHTQALAWSRAERANLFACLDYVTHRGQHARVVALTAGVASLLWHDGPWAEAITRETSAVQAAHHAGDRLGQANALHQLGAFRWRTGNYRGAIQALEEALGIYRGLGDRLGQANALTYLGCLQWLTGEHGGAAPALDEALGIYRDLGDRPGQASALTYLGINRRLTGDYRAAAPALMEALGIYRDLGDRRGHAYALNQLGAVRRETGDYLGAAQAQEEALGIYRDLDRNGKAITLADLGAVRRDTGDYVGATQALEEALGIFRNLGNRRSQAITLADLGAVRRDTGDYLGAAQALEEALGICRDLGNRGDEVTILNEAGALHRIRGDLDRAEASHRQALDLARAVGSSKDEAHALTGLGHCALAAGRNADAQERLQNALEVFQGIGAAQTACASAARDALTAAELKAN